MPMITTHTAPSIITVLPYSRYACFVITLFPYPVFAAIIVVLRCCYFYFSFIIISTHTRCTRTHTNMLHTSHLHLFCEIDSRTYEYFHTRSQFIRTHILHCTSSPSSLMVQKPTQPITTTTQCTLVRATASTLPALAVGTYSMYVQMYHVSTHLLHVKNPVFTIRCAKYSTAPHSPYTHYVHTYTHLIHTSYTTV